VSENLGLLQKFFEPLISLPFNDRCAEEAALIRLDLILFRSAAHALLGKYNPRSVS